MEQPQRELVVAAVAGAIRQGARAKPTTPASAAFASTRSGRKRTRVGAHEEEHEDEESSAPAADELRAAAAGGFASELPPPAVAALLAHPAQLRSQLRGIRNHGNSCYLGAPLQCLANLRSVANFFSDAQRHEAISTALPDSVSARFLSACASLYARDPNCRSISIAQLHARLRHCGGVSQEELARDAPGDAPASLGALLDALHVELSPAPVKAATSGEPSSRRSIISQLFGFNLQTFLECSGHGCSQQQRRGGLPSRIDSSTMLTVPLRLNDSSTASQPVTLQQCLQFSLEGQSTQEYVCSAEDGGCGAQGTTTNFQRLDELPPVMAIQLKRATFTSSHGLIADSTPCSYPMEMDLDFLTRSHSKQTMQTAASSAPSSGSARYRLQGVVLHLPDPSAHYVAYARISNDHWACFDDESCRMASASEVLQESNHSLVYLFLYERVAGAPDRALSSRSALFATATRKGDDGEAAYEPPSSSSSVSSSLESCPRRVTRSATFFSSTVAPAPMLE